MDSNDILIWAHREHTLVGTGNTIRIDPGTGPNRYSRALAALRESGREIAFASFTFDSQTSGSKVIVPSQVSTSRELIVPNRPIPDGTVISNGKAPWQDGIDRAFDALDSGSVDKVVLARQVEVRFDAELPISTIAARLKTSQPDCYTFAVDGLVGASPELLVSLTEGVIASLVLAGTAPTAESLDSAKMDLEHVLAASSVEASIARHVTTLAAPRRTVLDFGEIKHLATRFEGPASNGATIMEVLATLHPTASVAGTPTSEALKLIKEIEPLSRQRFAGPVGWFNTDGEGEFAIALRCGLIDGRRVTLYAGGGLVHGSDAASEFEETELKLRPMLTALNLE